MSSITSLILPYLTVTGELAEHASSAADAAAIANLPAIDPFPDPALHVTAAGTKAWGLIPADQTEIDGSIGFSSVSPFSFDPANRAVPHEFDFIGAAEHELTHILGRDSRLGVYTPLDLFRYADPGIHPLFAPEPSYFSVDGGQTDLNPFDLSTDLGDGASSVHGGSFGYSQPGITEQMTPTDITVMNVLGYSVASTPPALSRSGISRPHCSR